MSWDFDITWHGVLDGVLNRGGILGSPLRSGKCEDVGSK